MANERRRDRKREEEQQQGGERGEPFARAAQAGGEAFAGGVRTVGRQTEQMSRGVIDAFGVYGETIQAATQHMQSLMACSRAIADSMPQTQRALMSWFSSNMATHTRLAQDLLQCGTLHDLAQVQRRYVQESIDALMQGSAEVMRSANELLDSAVGEIEQAGRAGGEEGATVADVMSKDVKLVAPDDTVQDAARVMGEEDTGALPVGEGDKLVGMVTDRDIAIRVAAVGKDPKSTKVEEVMTPEVNYVFEDEDLEHVAENMAEQHVRRLPVVNREKRLVGIVSLGDIATEMPPHLAGQALSGIAHEGGEHRPAPPHHPSRPRRAASRR